MTSEPVSAVAPGSDVPADSSPAATSGPRFPIIDGLRVVAMFMVLVLHADASSVVNTTGVVHDILGRADAAVPVFLMISAFLLFRPVVLAYIDDSPPPRLMPYLGRRLVRIYPGYWFILLILVLIDAVELSTLRDYVLAITLLYPLVESPFVGGAFSGLGQTWAVFLLFQLYILIPVLGVLFRRILPKGPARDEAVGDGWFDVAPPWLTGMLGWTFGLTAAGFAFRSILAFGTAGNELNLVVYLPFWLDVTAPGLAMAVLVAANERDVPLPAPLRWLGRHPLAGWLAALVFYAAITRVSIPEGIGNLGPEYSLRYVAYAGFSTALVATAVVTTADRGLVAQVLASSVMGWLSALSVGFFVSHLGIMGRVEEWLGYEPFRAEVLPLILITTPLAVLVALAANRFAERPAVALTRRYLR